MNLNLFYSDTAGNLTLTTHLAGIWEGLMRHNAQCSAESFTALQREKSHCCQQTRLTIWWGVNIFSVTVCKHCFFHPSHRSEHTPLCIFMRLFLHGCKYSLLAIFWELEVCWPGAPAEPLSWFLRLTTFSGRNVNRHIHISCQCICFPSGQYKLHHAGSGQKEDSAEEGSVIS